MSIKSRMKPVEVLTPQNTSTTLGTVKTYVPERTIQASFSLISGTTANTNSTIYSSSTHTALTTDRNITTRQRIQDGDNIYTITYVNNDGRYSVLFLSLAK